MLRMAAASTSSSASQAACSKWQQLFQRGQHSSVCWHAQLLMPVACKTWLPRMHCCQATNSDATAYLVDRHLELAALKRFCMRSWKQMFWFAA